jgi:excinuclease UvrABC nuclease subunit
VPGVGPKKRKALLKAFDNSIDAIRSASVEDLMTVAGINQQLALAIKELL